METQAEGRQMALLELPPLDPPDYPSGLTAYQRAKLFHERNPHVHAWIQREALVDKRRGVRRSNVQAYFTRLRNVTGVRTTGDGGYKISNSFSPYYTRLLLETTPELVGFFVKGKLKGEEPEERPLDAPERAVTRVFKDLGTDALFTSPEAPGRVFRKTTARNEYDPEADVVRQYNAIDQETGATVWAGAEVPVTEVKNGQGN